MTVEHPELNAAAIMAAADKRISSIAKRFGVNSPEVLSACERWGGILDDVNFPDTTCRWCGHPVTWGSRYHHYVHSDRNDGAGDRAARWCTTHAGAVATPEMSPSEKEQAAARLTPVKSSPSGVGFIPTDAKKTHPVTDKPYRKLYDNPQA